MNLGRLQNLKDEIRKEIGKVKDLQSLKKEVVYLAQQIRTNKIDLGLKMSPKQKAKLEKLEVRYQDMMKNLAQAQKQFDKELTQFMRVLKRARVAASNFGLSDRAIFGYPF